MAKFAFLLPRHEMVEPAARIGEELGMKVVYNRWVEHSEDVLAYAENACQLGADIIVARGRQAALLQEAGRLPVVEIRFTGQEVALLLYRAKQLVPDIPRPRLGVVTLPNMIDEIHYLEEVLGVEIHTYFANGSQEMESATRQAVADNMDVILGGDLANRYCRRRGLLTYPWEGTEDSIRSSLERARRLGDAFDNERKNTAHLEALLAYSFNGIIEFSAEERVIRFNDIACKLLGREREELVGRDMEELLGREDADLVRETLRGGKELYFTVLSIGGVDVLANAAQISAGDESAGVVFSFYEMRTMERRESRALRERYRLHRYLARGRFEDVSNASQSMRRVVRMTKAFAKTTHPILIQGEVGNGKSLFAQSIHNASPCACGPFVTFPCLRDDPDQASRLAAAMRDANRGTLCLDGVEALGAAGQYMVRRLLEEQVVQGPGEELPSPVSVRVIVTTDGRLSAAVAEGRFRPDLFYLLAPMTVELPALHERRDDLGRAIDLCLEDSMTKLDRFVVLTREARKVLTEYRWPGNYTQLETFLERMVLTAPSRAVGDSYVRELLEQLYPDLDGEDTEGRGTQLPDQAAQLLQALEAHGGNRAAAAEALGISKTTLWRRMKRYGISGQYRTDL